MNEIKTIYATHPIQLKDHVVYSKLISELFMETVHDEIQRLPMNIKIGTEVKSYRLGLIQSCNHTLHECIMMSLYPKFQQCNNLFTRKWMVDEIKTHSVEELSQLLNLHIVIISILGKKVFIQKQYKPDHSNKMIVLCEDESVYSSVGMYNRDSLHTIFQSTLIQNNIELLDQMGRN
jgi:hypothetical protein